MTEPIVITTPSQLPAQTLTGITAPTFLAAIAEYERNHRGAWIAWQYGNTFYFEAKP